MFGNDLSKYPQDCGIPLPGPPGLDCDKDSDIAGSTRSPSYACEDMMGAVDSSECSSIESPLVLASKEALDCETDLSLPPACEVHTKGKRKSKDHKGSFIVLRGLPWVVTEQQVLTFVREAGLARSDLASEPVTLLMNSKGEASGFAEVHLAEGVDLWTVRQSLHMKHLGGRYIEALPPKPSRHSLPRIVAQSRARGWDW